MKVGVVRMQYCFRMLIIFDIKLSVLKTRNTGCVTVEIINNDMHFISSLFQHHKNTHTV